MPRVPTRLSILARHALWDERLVVRIPTLAYLAGVLPIVDTQGSPASRARTFVAIVGRPRVAPVLVIRIFWMCPCNPRQVDWVCLYLISELVLDQPIVVVVLQLVLGVVVTGHGVDNSGMMQVLLEL